MDRRAKGTLITIIGIASLAAIGAAVGAATHQHSGSAPRQMLLRGKRRMAEIADWQALSGLLERLVDLLPRAETERVLQRLQARLKDF